MSVSIASDISAPPEEDSSAGTEAGTEARQFVIFHVADEMFAVPLADVQEIIRLPDVVRMPLSPHALEGLANLRGSVLPIINLRSVFGFPSLQPDDATRVVVLDQGRPVGLVVDRMANVVTVENDTIESADSIRATVDTGLLTGMIKGRRDASIVMILDAASLIRQKFSDGVRSDRSSGASGALPPPIEEKNTRDADAALDETQLVSFEVAGQEYAFPIEEVQEIVQLPEKITGIPSSRPHVLGVITLRNRLLPLVSLRDMFGLPRSALSEANKVVVVSPGNGMGDGPLVGVVMDSIREVLRVSRTAIDLIPALLSQGRSLDDIQSICRLDKGRRLVSVLSATRMFDLDEVRQAVAAAGEEGVMADETDNRLMAASDDEEQFVVFRLMKEEYGVPIGSVQEIVRVPDELTRVPKTPDFIEGVINLRGSVLPVVDQRRRFGLSAAARNDRQRIMVFTIRGIRTGFIVDSVSEVMRIPARFIDGAPKLSAEQQKLIRRVANLETQKRMILLLDVNQLLNVQELETLQE